MRDTDRDWERYGRLDPYYGVLSDERFRRDRLTPEARAAFFATGEEEAARLFAVVRAHLAPGFDPRRALDFGCGVGRLLLPVARRCGEAVGVDVSQAMLEEARGNCAAAGVTNVSLARADDALSAVEGRFELIYSSIVFQHIPVRRGFRILDALLGRLAPGGVGALHFTFRRTRLDNRLRAAAKRVPFAAPVYNLLSGRDRRTPPMQMNCYDAGRVLAALAGHGVRECWLEGTDHGGHLGAQVYFRTPAQPGVAWGRTNLTVRI